MKRSPRAKLYVVMGVEGSSDTRGVILTDFRDALRCMADHVDGRGRGAFAFVMEARDNQYIANIAWPLAADGPECRGESIEGMTLPQLQAALATPGPFPPRGLG